MRIFDHGKDASDWRAEVDEWKVCRKMSAPIRAGMSEYVCMPARAQIAKAPGLGSGRWPRRTPCGRCMPTTCRMQTCRCMRTHTTGHRGAWMHRSVCLRVGPGALAWECACVRVCVRARPPKTPTAMIAVLHWHMRTCCQEKAARAQNRVQQLEVAYQYAL